MTWYLIAGEHEGGGGEVVVVVEDGAVDARLVVLGLG